MRSITKMFFLFISFSIYSQEMKPIEADRPDQTETPSIVPKGMFQVETGFTFQKNDESDYTYSLPSSLWKYGLNANFEFRLITEYVNEKTEEGELNGLVPIYVGFKVKLTEEIGLIPKTSYIAHISLQNAFINTFKTNCFAPQFRFVMQHTLSEKISISYNIGAEWDGFSVDPTFIYTFATGYSITKKMGSYIELFGFAPYKSNANHNFDGGITYLINDNFMLDLSASVGITKNAPQHYIAVGFSYRR